MFFLQVHIIWSLFKIPEKFDNLSICYFVMYNDSNTSKFRNNLNVKTKNLLKTLSANNKQPRLFMYVIKGLT